MYNNKFGYMPGGTAGQLMGNKATRAQGENMAFDFASSDRGLMHREQMRKQYETETDRMKNNILAGLLRKVQF